MSVFNWVKLAYAFTHFPTYLHFIHNPTNQPFKLSTTLLTALLITPLFLHLSPCYYLYTLHRTTHTITVKGSNNTIDKTLYINNITIPQHTQNPPELKIEPCRTMLYFKAQNRLSESRLYSIDIIIKRYNITALNQTIQLLQAIKKALYTSVYNALLIRPFIY